MPELCITLLGHPALELLEECRGNGWADDSAETVAAFKSGVPLEAGGPRVDLFSFDGCTEGGQFAWAVVFDPDAKVNKECVLSGAFSNGKRVATKAVLKLNKAHVIRLGLLGLCSGTVTFTFHKTVGGFKGGVACASWDEVFAEDAAQVEVELKHGVRILLKAREEV